MDEVGGRGEYRSALGVFALVLGLQLGPVAAFNWFVNPFQRYPTRLVGPVVADDHRTKLRLLQRQRPELLVLGSSRVQKLEPAYLQLRTGLRVFNLGVANGLPEDDLCFFRYATEGLRLPIRSVILGG